jgi:phage tail-like protein
MRTSFNARLGSSQGRITEAVGRVRFVLGDAEPGHVYRLAPGDHVEVSQDVDLADVDVLRARVRLRSPSSRAVWEAQLWVGDELRARRASVPGDTRGPLLLSANVKGVDGVERVAVRLALASAPRAEFVELPELVLEEVSGSRAEGLLLANEDPAPGEARASVQSRIALDLFAFGAEPLRALRIWVQDEAAFDSERGGSLGTFDVRQTASAGVTRVVLWQAQPFPSNSLLTVRVAAETASSSLDHTYDFRTEDRTAPVVVAAVATSPRSVAVEFDEAVRLRDDAEFALASTTVPAVSPRVRDAASDGVLVTLELDAELTPGARYEVRARGVEDARGNAVEPPLDRTTFLGFAPPFAPERHFSLWEMLPKHNRRDDSTGDLARFVSCFQEVANLLLADIDRFTDLFDFARAPPPFVDLILEDLGNPFAFELDTLEKRRLASVLVDLYRTKGTAVGIQNAIRFFLAIEVDAITPYAGETLALGDAELDASWVLGPSDRFARYAFDVEVSRALNAKERRMVRALVNYLKPAHTHFVDLREGRPMSSTDDWILGESALGVASRLIDAPLVGRE